MWWATTPGASRTGRGRRSVLVSLDGSLTLLGVEVDRDFLFGVGLPMAFFALASLRNWSGWFYFDVRMRRGRSGMRWRAYLLFLGVAALAVSQGADLPAAVLAAAVTAFALEPALTAKALERSMRLYPLPDRTPEGGRHAKPPVPARLLGVTVSVLLAPTAVPLGYLCVALLS